MVSVSISFREIILIQLWFREETGERLLGAGASQWGAWSGLSASGRRRSSSCPRCCESLWSTVCDVIIQIFMILINKSLISIMIVLSYIKFSFNSIELNSEWQNERRIIIILCSYLFSKPCSMQSKSGAKNVWLFSSEFCYSTSLNAGSEMQVLHKRQSQWPQSRVWGRFWWRQSPIRDLWWGVWQSVLLRFGDQE